MKFAAQLMQFMVLIPAATLCFLPMKNQLTAPPAGDAALLLSCIDLFAVCRQRHFCPVLFSRL
ncbi:MAG: hypothetical protein V8R67_01320 [Eubacterium sp.]